MSRQSIATAFFSLFIFALFLGTEPGWGQSSGRPFLMGTTPFFTTPALFPDVRFENLSDKDILSLHLDDFWGVPWANFQNNTAPPAAWASQWQALASSATATGKILYLAVSPLGGRKTLTRNVDASGIATDNWAPVDSSGCYTFATDPNAAKYMAAYINYSKYIINLVKPRFFSPAVEMNIPFGQCPSQKAAWINWYAGVHNALKASYPDLVIFPTFQMETMYGISDAASSCGCNIAVDIACNKNCFRQRLTESLTLPGDRMAFSTYPAGWGFAGQSISSYDPFSQVAAATNRRIWIAETGWNGVHVLNQYAHPSPATACGTDLYPASLYNDANISTYLSWLLQQAQSRQFESVIWWLNRDYLDGAVAAACPCPGSNDTCTLAENFFTAGAASGGAASGNTTEFLLRIFGNMALRYYNGSPRPAYASWNSSMSLPLISSQTVTSSAFQNILYQAYPGAVSLQIPPQTFASPVILTLSMPTSFPVAGSPAGNLVPANVGVQIDTDVNVQPSLEATLVVGFRDSDVAGLDRSRLILARYDTGRNVWVPLVSHVNAGNNTVTAKTNHFSLFQIMQAGPSAGVSVAKAFPNPMRPSQGQNYMTFALLPANARIRIYDLKGSLIKDLTADATGMALWDGTNQSGVPVASGVYFVFAQGAGDSRTLKVAIQR